MERRVERKEGGLLVRDERRVNDGLRNKGLTQRLEQRDRKRQKNYRRFKGRV